MDNTNGEAENLTSSTSAQPSGQFTIAEIQSATNNFDDELVIGQGGFGKVYKGQISIEDSSHFVAIKRLDSISNQGEAEFKAEIEMLSKLRHCNLVSLVGYCDDNREMILVYAYMPHGTLYDHLHKVTATPLSWIQRLKIAIGAGRGLDYLHTGFGTQRGVIHRDVKSSNILLDENWAAMISDFGLSKIGPIDQASNNISVSVKGTFGYLDPEYFYTSKLTRKTDVYAFGVVLFELLSGKLAVDTRLTEEQGSLARWAQKCVKERKYDQMVDSNIIGTFAPKVLRGFAEIANRCLFRDFEKRPSMTQVVAKLQDLLELQVKWDNNSADSPGASGFTWMIHKYRASATNRNSGQDGTGFRKSNENHMNQGSVVNRDGDDHGKKPHQQGELVAGDIKIFTYDELERAIMNFKNYTGLGVDSYANWWIDKTGDLKMLKEFRHPNLVKVIGYCKGDNLLVFEFVHNGNFENLLRSGTIRLLPLATKVKIAVGIARGIVYLCNTTDNVGKLVSYFSQDSELYEWDKTICAFELDKYKILLNEDFTAKLLEYDITKLVEDRDYDKRDLQYHITGLVDGDYYPGFSPPEVDFTLETKLFSSFRSVFTEVLTGRKFSLEEFHKIDYSLRKDGKQSLGLVAKLCYEKCNTIDSEQMMLKYFEEYDNYIHMGSRHLRGEGTFNYQIQSSPYVDAGEESIPESMRIAHIIQKRLFTSNRW